MHTNLELTTYLGDTKTFRIPLRWGNRAFDPTGCTLIFTVKADDADVDDDALIQKRTGGLGITVSGTTALVRIESVDTAGSADPVIAALSPATTVFDIHAQNNDDPDDIRTVAKGTLVLLRDITQGNDTAVPIYVANPGITYDTQLITYS